MGGGSRPTRWSPTPAMHQPRRHKQRNSRRSAGRVGQAAEGRGVRQRHGPHRDRHRDRRSGRLCAGHRHRAAGRACAHHARAEPARWIGGGSQHEDRHFTSAGRHRRAGAGPGHPERRTNKQISGQPPATARPAAGQPEVRRHERHPVETRRQRSSRVVAGGAGLVARGVGKTYKKRPVVRNVTIELRRGEAVGLLGPNGAGKTTTFYMIVGLVQPDTGSISLDGADITSLPMYRRARLGIGYLPQEASVFRGLNVEQNVMAALEVAEPDRRQARPDAGRAAGRIRHRPSAPHAGAGAVRRRAAAGGDRPRAGDPARAISCWTSRWPASTLSRSARSAIWCRI